MIALLFLAPLLVAQQDPPSRPKSVSPNEEPEDLWRMVEAVSPDGKAIAIALDDGSVRIIALPTGQERCRTPSLPRVIGALGWARDGTRLAAVSFRGDIRVLDARDGKIAASFDRILVDPTERGNSHVHSIDFVHGDAALLTGCGSSKGRLLDASTGKIIREISYGEGSTISASAVSADGLHVAFGDSEGNIGVHSAVTGELEAGPFRTPPYVYSLAFAPHATRLAAGSGDAKARVFTIGKDAPTLELEHDGRLKLGGEPTIGSVSFSPDGSSLLSSTCNDLYEVRCWDLAHSTVRWKYEYRSGTEWPAPATFTTSGDFALLWVEGLVIDMKTGEQARHLATTNEDWNFSGKGDIAWVRAKGNVKVYEVHTGKLLCDISLAASPAPK